MLEGKEFDKMLGQYGEVSVDLDDKGVLAIAIGLKVDLLVELEKLAQKSGKDWLVKGVDMLKGVIKK